MSGMAASEKLQPRVVRQGRETSASPDPALRPFIRALLALAEQLAAERERVRKGKPLR